MTELELCLFDATFPKRQLTDFSQMQATGPPNIIMQATGPPKPQWGLREKVSYEMAFMAMILSCVPSIKKSFLVPTPSTLPIMSSSNTEN
jgi:hypothetical protein